MGLARQVQVAVAVQEVQAAAADGARAGGCCLARLQPRLEVCHLEAQRLQLGERLLQQSGNAGVSCSSYVQRGEMRFHNFVFNILLQVPRSGRTQLAAPLLSVASPLAPGPAEWPCSSV